MENVSVILVGKKLIVQVNKNNTGDVCKRLVKTRPDKYSNVLSCSPGAKNVTIASYYSVQQLKLLQGKITIVRLGYI